MLGSQGSLPSWIALISKHFLKAQKNHIGSANAYVLLLQPIVEIPKYNTIGLIIYYLPQGMSNFLSLCGRLIKNGRSKLSSYPFQLLCYEHYVQVSFLVNIIRSSQLIISENESDKSKRHDPCNKQNIPCINKELSIQDENGN